VHHALTVCVRQRIYHVAEDSHSIGHGQLALAGQSLPKRLAFHERHGVVEKVVRGTGSKQRDDMRVLEAGGKLHLPSEPISVDSRGKLRWQPLDDDPPLEFTLLGHEDATHPPAPQLSLEVVGVTERALQALAKFGQVNGLYNGDP